MRQGTNHRQWRWIMILAATVVLGACSNVLPIINATDADALAETKTKSPGSEERRRAIIPPPRPIPPTPRRDMQSQFSSNGGTGAATSPEQSQSADDQCLRALRAYRASLAGRAFGEPTPLRDLLLISCADRAGQEISHTSIY